VIFFMLPVYGATPQGASPVSGYAWPTNAPLEGAAADGTPAEGALDAVLGDVVAALHAAKTTDKDAANTAPLADHLFGEWDMLPVSSSEAPGGPLASLSGLWSVHGSSAGPVGPGADRRKPSISASGRHYRGPHRVSAAWRAG
jgi:hypothetical protein